MFNNNGQTGPAEKHTFHPSHPTVAVGTHMHRQTCWKTCRQAHIHRHLHIITHTLTHTIMIHVHALCREMCETLSFSLSSSPSLSHTHTFCNRHWSHHWCVCLYDQCWPQRIWPSFRNNGHGEWLAGWASWLWEVTGGMLNDIPRMERWRERVYMGNRG